MSAATGNRLHAMDWLPGIEFLEAAIATTPSP
jgi:hypothetical protein